MCKHRQGQQGHGLSAQHCWGGEPPRCSGTSRGSVPPLPDPPQRAGTSSGLCLPTGEQLEEQVSTVIFTVSLDLFLNGQINSSSLSSKCFLLLGDHGVPSMVTAETEVNRLKLLYSSEFHRNLDS